MDGKLIGVNRFKGKNDVEWVICFVEYDWEDYEKNQGAKGLCATKIFIDASKTDGIVAENIGKPVEFFMGMNNRFDCVRLKK